MQVFLQNLQIRSTFEWCVSFLCLGSAQLCSAQLSCPSPQISVSGVTDSHTSTPTLPLFPPSFLPPPLFSFPFFRFSPPLSKSLGLPPSHFFPPKAALITALPPQLHLSR